MNQLAHLTPEQKLELDVLCLKLQTARHIARAHPETPTAKRAKVRALEYVVAIRELVEADHAA